MSWLKMFAIFGVVSDWLIKAAADGKVTTNEIISLVTQLLQIAGVKAAIELGSDFDELKVTK
jgi:hypothetical protein